MLGERPVQRCELRGCLNVDALIIAVEHKVTVPVRLYPPVIDPVSWISVPVKTDSTSDVLICG